MIKQNEWLIALWGAVFTFFTYLFGAFDPVLHLLVYIMVFDFFTGVLNAAMTYSHQKAVIGVLTKFMYLLIVGLGARIDATGLYAEPIARTALAWGVVIIELGSVVENFDKLGIPVPDFLLKVVSVIQRKGEGHSEQ